MILDAFRLDGKVALVTGAGQGLGAAMAIGLAEAGADVVVLDRAPLDETASAIQSVGRRTLTLSLDLAGTTSKTAASIVESCCAAFGGIDILVNNAGIIRRSSALDTTEADWRSVIDIDLNSVFFLAQAAARHFVAAGKPGKIINVASMLSFQGGVLVPSYTAAKSAVAGLTRALANEWASLYINVNAIAPGYFATDVTSAIREDPARSAALLARIPANRWGAPEDLKGLAVFLASDASQYVHGAIIPVDGGWLSR
jgi:2-deoxy-D-gluconate 3-dehydrogenase